MKHLVKLMCSLAVAMFLIAVSVGATVIADWTFETSYGSITGSSTSLGPLSPEVGAGSAFGVHANISDWDAYYGNGSMYSFCVNNWSVGDYYQFQVDTFGLTGISIDWDQTGSYTAPADFVLQYSNDGSTYTTFGSQYSVLLYNQPSWRPTSGSTNYHFTCDLSSVDASVGNQATAYFRLVANSDVAINGDVVGENGVIRIDNFTVSGVPEPSTVILAGLGLVALMAIRGRS